MEENEKDTFGMLVHSCYVDNGYGDRVDILSEKGCGLDAVLLSTPDYDDSLRLATKAYHVFKYADRPVLQFQCQITLCLKYDGGCDGITPPKNCPTLYGENGVPNQLDDYSRVYRRQYGHLNRNDSNLDFYAKKPSKMNPTT
uniref:ZP domain-containing protein n=1 Tax=Angiostrongylus cantonensis TaxID=6313 RepID=A0A0K0D220_ANGCA